MNELALKTSPEVSAFLQHYGVLGMKWGHRKTATGTQIKAARKRLKDDSKSYSREYKKLETLSPGSSKRKAIENNLRKRHRDYLKNPDRVIAARMTQGEKFFALVGGTSSGVGTAVTLGTIAATSATSRRIEYKQERGDYNKKDAGPIHKTLGLQRARGFAVNGALMAPGILSYVGQQASARIIVKAAANRNAAKVVGPRAIASTAQKLKYVAKSRGAYKITTMK